MIDELIRILPLFDVVSFDIFGTLLLRPLMNPQDVWRIIEEKEGAPGFAKTRRKADAKTYAEATKRGGETTLDEAYALMPRWVGMKDKELEWEARLLVPNPEIVALWRKAGELGKKRVIVSDMYLPAEFVRKQLRLRGIDGWDGFYLSSDRGARKTTGELFKVMLDEVGVSPERVMHIGDNRQSDVIIPEQLGVASFEYVGVGERFTFDHPFISVFLEEGPSFAKDRFAGALAVGWHMYRFEHPQATYWNKIGFLFGGVLGFMYIDWVVKTARRQGFTHLMFIGRDGFIWQKICNEIAPDLKTDYFYAPRTISIRVNGPVGNDPSAIKDRQRYIKENRLAEADAAKVLSNYRKYFDHFCVDPEKTVLVDGCSSGFSAQKLVETTVDASIFTFYLMTMCPVKNGAVMYSSRQGFLPFQNFSEFVFGSPEPPIKNISHEGVLFNESPSVFERMKVSCSEDIAKGAVACATWLRNGGIIVTPQMWMEYFDAFTRYLTVMDRENLALAKNSTDVGHRMYRSVIPSPPKTKRRICSLFGHDIVSIRYSWRDGVYFRTLTLFDRWSIYSKSIKVFDMNFCAPRSTDRRD